MRTVGRGVALTLVVTALLSLVRGPSVIMAVAAMGLLATGIQVVATRKLRASMLGTNHQFFVAVGSGMALRLAGVAAMAVATVVAPTQFPLLPTALGFLGVLVPLLFLEVYLIR